MSVLGGTGGRAVVMSRLRDVETRARAVFAVLARPVRCRVARPSTGRLAFAGLAAVAAVLLTVVLLDRPMLEMARHLPRAVVDALNAFTDFGRSGWFLVPTGVMLLALIALDSPAMRRIDRAVLAAFAVRLGFVFAAIALPSLFVSVVKRLIGRARPFVDGDHVWSAMPFAWKVQYASFPSGHGTTAFAALAAIGALFPEARALMWTYAVLIALSRVAITAHHPSDVVASAIVGVLGALLVRNWFAARSLAFTVGRDGGVRPMPGPGWGRIVKAVARRLRAA